MFEGIGKALNLLFIIVAIAVPIAIWKLVEVLIWLWHHIKISLA